MSRKEGQKRKLLVLLEILARETDEKHPLSVPSAGAAGVAAAAALVLSAAAAAEHQ